MLNFFKRTAIKAKLALNDASAPEDAEMLALLPMCDRKKEEVEELSKQFVQVLQQHASLRRANSALTGVLDVFYSRSPNKQTDALVHSYVESASLLNSNAPFQLKMKQDVLLPITKWEKDVDVLVAKIDCYEQANVHLYGVKYEVADLQNDQAEILKKNQTVPEELKRMLAKAQQELRVYTAALEWMRADIFSLAQRTVQPDGFHALFDSLLARFIALQQEWLSASHTISERVKLPPASENKESKTSSSSSSSSSVTWSNFESGEEALEQISVQLDTSNAAASKRSASASVASSSSSSPNKGMLDEGVVSTAADRTTNTSTLVADISYSPATPEKQEVTTTIDPVAIPPSSVPLKVEAREENESKQQQRERVWVEQQLSDGKLSVPECEFVENVTWRERVDLWTKAAKQRQTACGAEHKISQALLVLALLPSLTCVIMEQGERRMWFDFWVSSLESSSDNADRGVMKAYRKALKLFSSFAHRPDGMEEADHAFVTSKVVDTLKRAFMTYQQAVKSLKP